MGNAAVLADIARHFRNAVATQVLLARTNDATYLPNRRGHEGRILEVGDPNPDVHPFLDQIHDAIQEQQIGTDEGMALKEFAQDRANVAAAEQHRSGDGELALRLGAARDQGIFRFLNLGENDTTMLKISRPLVRQMDSAGGAIEERYTELKLKGSQRADDGGQRCIERTRGGGLCTKVFIARNLSMPMTITSFFEVVYYNEPHLLALMKVARSICLKSAEFFTFFLRF
jgi:hypothetical protein